MFFPCRFDWLSDFLLCYLLLFYGDSIQLETIVSNANESKQFFLSRILMLPRNSIKFKKHFILILSLEIGDLSVNECRPSKFPAFCNIDDDQRASINIVQFSVINKWLQRYGKSRDNEFATILAVPCYKRYSAMQPFIYLLNY